MRVENSLSLMEVFQSLKLSNKPKQMEFNGVYSLIAKKYLLKKIKILL